MNDPLEPSGPTESDWEQIASYLAGEMSPADASAFAAMLAAHPARAALVESLAIHGEPAAMAPPSDIETEHALQMVRARRNDSMTRTARHDEAPVVSLDRYRSRWRGARARAAAAVVLVAGAGLLLRETTGRDAGAPVATGAIHQTGVGEVESIRLGDGSRVILGPSSTLTEQGGTSRGARLRGVAHFTVTHNPSAPFVVTTASARIEDVGTVFVVDDGDAEGTVVAVSEGAVRAAAAGGGAIADLAAGDRAMIAANRAVTVQRGGADVQAAQELAAGRLVFRDAPVSEVVRQVRRWYGLTVAVDSSLVSRRLTATFDRRDAGSVAAVIAASLGGVARQHGDSLTVMPLVAAPR